MKRRAKLCETLNIGSLETIAFGTFFPYAVNWCYVQDVLSLVGCMVTTSF